MLTAPPVPAKVAAVSLFSQAYAELQFVPPFVHVPAPPFQVAVAIAPV
jgi:hypothetical protein